MDPYSLSDTRIEDDERWLEHLHTRPIRPHFIGACLPFQGIDGVAIGYCGDRFGEDGGVWFWVLVPAGRGALRR